MDSVVLFKLCFLFLCQTAGCTDVKSLFVQTGKDVLLDIMDPDAVKGYLFLTWRVKKKDSKLEVLVVFVPDKGPIVSKKYIETVFPQTNLSVILKNLQKADSGLYNAEVTTLSGSKTLVPYNLTVQDPVSAVEVSVNPVSFGPHSCNVTASCTTDDHTISSNFTCTNQTCTGQDEAEVTPSAASLHIYLLDGSVTCNHSNQVNWTTASAPIDPFCFNDPVAGPQCVSADVTILRVKIAVYSVGLVVMVSAVISVHFMKTFNKREQPSTSEEK